jgi:hypothetical protein
MAAAVAMSTSPPTNSIQTQLIPLTILEVKVAQFGGNVPLERAGQSEDADPRCVFLAPDDGSYFSGPELHPQSGTVVSWRSR